MAEELEKLLDKIRRDGVEKAEAEAAGIIDAARKQAESIKAEAEKSAAASRASAEKDAEAFAKRSEESVRQAARDILESTAQAVTALLEKALAENVDAALADPAVAAPLAAEAVSQLVKGAAEIQCAPKLVESLRAQLAAKKELSVVPAEDLRSGFRVRIDGGRVEHDFGAQAVADALASRLRPRLAALVRL